MPRIKLPYFRVDRQFHQATGSSFTIVEVLRHIVAIRTKEADQMRGLYWYEKDFLQQLIDQHKIWPEDNDAK